MSRNVIRTITAGSEKHTVIGTVADIQGVVYPAASGSERQHDTVPEERAELCYRVRNRLRYIYIHPNAPVECCRSFIGMGIGMCYLNPLLPFLTCIVVIYDEEDVQ